MSNKRQLIGKLRRALRDTTRASYGESWGPAFSSAVRMHAVLRRGPDRTSFVLGSEDRKVYVVSSDSGEIEWEFATYDSVEAGVTHDLDGDGFPEIIVASADGNVYALDSRPELSDTDRLRWKYSLSTEGDLAAYPRSIAVSDLDGDGHVELVIGGDAEVIHILSSAGGTKGGLNGRIQLGARVRRVAVADVDRDGKPEILAGRYDGTLSVLNVYGERIASFTTREKSWVRGLVVRDVDNDGWPEIFVGSEDGCVHALKWHETNRTVEEFWQFKFRSSLEDGSSWVQDWIFDLECADLDGNGRPEIVVAPWDHLVYVLDLDDLGKCKGIKWVHPLPERAFSVHCVESQHERPTLIVGMDGGAIERLTFSDTGVAYGELLELVDRCGGLAALEEHLDSRDWNALRELVGWPLRLVEEYAWEDLRPTRWQIHLEGNDHRRALQAALRIRDTCVFRHWPWGAEQEGSHWFHCVAVVGNRNSSQCIAAGTEDGWVYLFDSAGKQLDSRKVANGLIDCMIVADVDGDDVDEIVLGTGNGEVYAVWPKDGLFRRQLWQSTEDEAIHDLAFVKRPAKRLFVAAGRRPGARTRQGTLYVISPQKAEGGEERWQVDERSSVEGATVSATAIVVGDHPGEIRVFLGLDRGEIRILDPAMRLRTTIPSPHGWHGRSLQEPEVHEVTHRISSLVAADLDMDGSPELVATGEDGLLRVFRILEQHGELRCPLLWTFAVPDRLTSVEALDVDMDGLLELVVASWTRTIYVLRSDGSIALEWSVGDWIMDISPFKVRSGEREYLGIVAASADRHVHGFALDLDSRRMNAVSKELRNREGSVTPGIAHERDPYIRAYLLEEIAETKAPLGALSIPINQISKDLYHPRLVQAWLKLCSEVALEDSESARQMFELIAEEVSPEGSVQVAKAAPLLLDRLREPYSRWMEAAFQRTCPISTRGYVELLRSLRVLVERHATLIEYVIARLEDTEPTERNAEDQWLKHEMGRTHGLLLGQVPTLLSSHLLGRPLSILEFAGIEIKRDDLRRVLALWVDIGRERDPKALETAVQVLSSEISIDRWPDLGDIREILKYWKRLLPAEAVLSGREFCDALSEVQKLIEQFALTEFPQGPLRRLLESANELSTVVNEEDREYARATAYASLGALHHHLHSLKETVERNVLLRMSEIWREELDGLQGQPRLVLNARRSIKRDSVRILEVVVANRGFGRAQNVSIRVGIAVNRFAGAAEHITALDVDEEHPIHIRLPLRLEDSSLLCEVEYTDPNKRRRATASFLDVPSTQARRSARSGRLPNIFDNALREDVPVEQKPFKGRQRDIARVLSLISSGVSPIIIPGLYRAGKTTFLKRLMQELRQHEGFHARYLHFTKDLLDANPNGVLFALFEELWQFIPGNRPFSSAKPKSGSKINWLRKAFIELDRGLEERVLVVLVDEMEEFAKEVVREGRGSVFRSLMEETRGVRFVFTGPYLPKAASNMLSVGRTSAEMYPLRLLEKDAVRALLLEPTSEVKYREMVDFPEDAVRAIYEMTGGVPELVLRFGRRLIEVLNEERWLAKPVVTQAVVSGIFDEGWATTTAFPSFWTELAEPEIELLVNIVKRLGETPTREWWRNYVDLKALPNACSADGNLAKAVASARDRLLEMGILERTHKGPIDLYRVAIGWFAKYIHEREVRR